MNIYTFDDLQEGRKAVKMAMAEAGCFGPKIEEQMELEAKGLHFQVNGVRHQRVGRMDGRRAGSGRYYDG
jgi:hypothetical protein